MWVHEDGSTSRIDLKYNSVRHSGGENLPMFEQRPLREGQWGQRSRPRLCLSLPFILLSGNQTRFLQEILFHHSSKKRKKVKDRKRWAEYNYTHTHQHTQRPWCLIIFYLYLAGLIKMIWDQRKMISEQDVVTCAVYKHYELSDISVWWSEFITVFCLSSPTLTLITVYKWMTTG